MPRHCGLASRSALHGAMRLLRGPALALALFRCPPWAHAACRGGGGGGGVCAKGRRRRPRRSLEDACWQAVSWAACPVRSGVVLSKSVVLPRRAWGVLLAMVGNVQDSRQPNRGQMMLIEAQCHELGSRKLAFQDRPVGRWPGVKHAGANFLVLRRIDLFGELLLSLRGATL